MFRCDEYYYCFFTRFIIFDTKHHSRLDLKKKEKRVGQRKFHLLPCGIVHRVPSSMPALFQWFGFCLYPLSHSKCRDVNFYCLYNQPSCVFGNRTQSEPSRKPQLVILLPLQNQPQYLSRGVTSSFEYYILFFH